MNTIQVNSTLFTGSQVFYNIYKSLVFEKSLDKIITQNNIFYAEEIEDHIQVKYYSGKYKETKYLFHFPKGHDILGKDIYSVLCVTIRDAFIEYLI